LASFVESKPTAPRFIGSEFVKACDFSIVSRHTAPTLLVKEAEFDLSGGVPLIDGQLKEAHCLAIILRNTASRFVAATEFEQRLYVSLSAAGFMLLCRLAITRPRVF
jgi:hypothetical protein